MSNKENTNDSFELKSSSQKPNFQTLWDGLSVSLKDFIRKRISNEQDTEDILQEVFYKIHSKIDDLKDYDRIHAWIYKITRNTIVDYYRKKDKHIELTENIEDLASKLDEDISSNKEIAACLQAMIENLPEKYKQAITLTEFQNITQKELAAKLGISISAAKSRVQRGRLMLKETLLGCCHLEFDHRGNVIDYKHKSKNCKFC